MQIARPQWCSAVEAEDSCPARGQRRQGPRLPATVLGRGGRGQNSIASLARTGIAVPQWCSAVKAEDSRPASTCHRTRSRARNGARPWRPRTAGHRLPSHGRAGAARNGARPWRPRTVVVRQVERSPLPRPHPINSDSPGATGQCSPGHADLRVCSSRAVRAPRTGRTLAEWTSLASYAYAARRRVAEARPLRHAVADSFCQPMAAGASWRYGRLGSAAAAAGAADAGDSWGRAGRVRVGIRVEVRRYPRGGLRGCRCSGGLVAQPAHHERRAGDASFVAGGRRTRSASLIES